MPSSTIDRFEYDAATKTLSVWFLSSGRRYDYLGVPGDVVDQFRIAASRGRFFNSRIRDHYPSEWKAWEGPSGRDAERQSAPEVEPSASNVIPFPGPRQRL